MLALVQSGGASPPTSLPAKSHPKEGPADAGLSFERSSHRGVYDSSDSSLGTLTSAGDRCCGPRSRVSRWDGGLRLEAIGEDGDRPGTAERTNGGTPAVARPLILVDQ